MLAKHVSLAVPNAVKAFIATRILGESKKSEVIFPIAGDISICRWFKFGTSVYSF
jgi:hypothetical protein